MNQILRKPNSLEIVTDASIRTFNDVKRTFGCAGALCINTGEQDYMISQDTTNNRSELIGVFLGVRMANNMVKMNPGVFDEVVIYSDSKLAVYGLTQWMDDWVAHMDSNGVLYGSNGKPVKNQELYISILTYLVDNNLAVKFRHCAGHMALTYVKLEQANKVFEESNGYSLRPEDIYKVVYYNDVIDRSTRDKLKDVNPNRYPVLNTSNNYDVMSKFVFPMDYKQYVG